MHGRLFGVCPMQALHAAARRVKSRHPGVLVEASGGLTEQNVVEYLGPDVDVVSLGCATHRPDGVNFSLKIRAPGRDPTNPTVTSDDTHHSSE